MRFKPAHFIALWTLLNLFNGAFTELTSDEGYYWYYSTQPSWGYYDHPPMTAWMIWLGNSIFQNELGVRLLNILLLGFAVLLFFRLLRDQKDQYRASFILVLSVPLLNYFGIILFPDGPLLFFLAIFLLAYKNFLVDKGSKVCILLAISVAGMLYSKYYGVLVVLFVILSNLQLLKEFRLYVVLAAAGILYLPHLSWQWMHGFPSFQYHLSGRVSSWSGRHVIEYISQQIPTIGPALLIVPFFVRAKDRFEKALQFIIIGTFLFFFIVSFRAFVHFHWTSIALFPLLFFAARYYASTNRIRLLLWLTIPFILLILVARIHFAFRILPVDKINVDHYHGRRAWANEIRTVASDKPVVFINNFREPPLYSFYTGRLAGTLYTGEKRKSQYDIWGFEDSLQQRSVLLLQKNSFRGSTAIKTSLGSNYYFREIPRFASYYNVPIKVNAVTPGRDSVLFDLDIRNERAVPLYFNKDQDGNAVSLYYATRVEGDRNYEKISAIVSFTDADQIFPAQSRNIQVRIPKTIEGKAITHVSFGFEYGILADSYNVFVKLN